MGSLIWPQAEAEARKYKHTIDAINEERPKINKAASHDWNYKLENWSWSDYSDYPYGDYHDIFKARAEEWFSKAEGFVAAFAAFKVDMESVLAYAHTQYAIWHGRIGLRHPDPIEGQ
jgi:hypothetical protein